MPPEISIEPRQFAAILLAAGGSTRLGQPKQLVQFQGKSLLRHAAESAIDSGASMVIIVLGDAPEVLHPRLAGLPILPVINEAWRQGMSTSLRCGVEALQRQAPPETAALLMVCDQPFLTASHLKTLWARHVASGKVIAVRHGDQPGVPAIFPANYLSRLAQIAGDQGARSLLRAFSAQEIELMDLPEAIFDLDTPEDLVQFADKIRRTT